MLFFWRRLPTPLSRTGRLFTSGYFHVRHKSGHEWVKQDHKGWQLLATITTPVTDKMVTTIHSYQWDCQPRVGQGITGLGCPISCQMTQKMTMVSLLSVCRNLNKNQYGEVVLSGKIQDYCHSNDITQLRKHLAEGMPLPVTASADLLVCLSVCPLVDRMAGRLVSELVIRQVSSYISLR